MFLGTFPKTLGPRYEKGKVQLPQRIRNVSRRFVFKTESQPMTAPGLCRKKQKVRLERLPHSRLHDNDLALATWPIIFFFV